MKISEKQLELTRAPYSAFLKIEIPRFAERLIGIIEKHNPEELQIKKMYNLLVVEKPRIEKLTDKFGAQPLTEELAKLREMGSLRISKIRFRLKEVLKENKSGLNRKLEAVKSVFTHFLKNIEVELNR